MSSRTSISFIPYNPYPPTQNTMYNFPPNLVLEPSSSQRGHPTQSDEGTTSDMEKTKEEIFALAKKLVAQGPKSMKVAVIIQFEENQEFQDYGSPDVRNVVDNYLRLSSERIISELGVHLTNENPEPEETPPKRRYESIISPPPAERPLEVIRNYRQQAPIMATGRTISIAQMNPSNGVNPEDPEEELNTPPRHFGREPPTWGLAELPPRNSSSNTYTNFFQTPPGELVAPWGVPGIQPGLADSPNIIEEGVHDNGHPISFLGGIGQSDSFLQSFQASPPKSIQSDTVNVHEGLTSNAMSDHPAEPHHRLLGNAVPLMEENTKKEK